MLKGIHNKPGWYIYSFTSFYLYHPFLMIVLPSWERSHIPSQKSFLSRCFSGWNPFGGVGFLVFWRELPFWFDLGKASTLPSWSASWTPFRRGAKEKVGRMQFEVKLPMSYWWFFGWLLVVGCSCDWNGGVYSCNCPFTSTASLPEESYTITGYVGAHGILVSMLGQP